MNNRYVNIINSVIRDYKLYKLGIGNKSKEIIHLDDWFNTLLPKNKIKYKSYYDKGHMAFIIDCYGKVTITEFGCESMLGYGGYHTPYPITKSLQLSIRDLIEIYMLYKNE